MDSFLHSPTTTSGNLQSPTTTGNVQENSCSVDVSLSTASVQKGNHKHDILQDSPNHENVP